MALEYKVSVEGVEIDGHPLLWYFSNLTKASDCFDGAIIKYPNNKIIMSITKEAIQKISVPKPRAAVPCPRGHSGVQNNGQAVVLLGSDKKYFCATCGWKEA